MKKPTTTLVTGANSDIGASLCKSLLVAGARVIAVCHHGSSRLDPLKVEFKEKIQVIYLDFSDPSSTTEFIEQYQENLDKVDSFVSLAAMRQDVYYGEITARNLIDHFVVNVVPIVLLTQYLGESMALRGWGRIVIGSSIGVKFGGGDNTFCYSLTKYASELIPKAAIRWSESGVLTNVVRIGVTNTETLRAIGQESVLARAALVPMRRMAEPDEISRLLVWLISEENTFTTGQVISVSGGE